MEEYLYIQQLKLVHTKINTQDGLKKSILYENIIQADNTSNWQAGISVKSAKKWFNHLGYKWKYIQKIVLFNKYKQKNIVEYYKTFLKEIKSFLSFFVEF